MGRFNMQTLENFACHFSHVWKQCQRSSTFDVLALFIANLPGSDSKVWEGTSVSGIQGVQCALRVVISSWYMRTIKFAGTSRSSQPYSGILD